ncbi:MAG: GntR family transcriptional regulator [Pseudomonadota bacterium]
MNDLQPSAYQTLPEQIAERLRRSILNGDLHPGATIPERETSTDLGVSRTPLREAIRILASEGLVTMRPARSPVVANPSLRELADLFTVQAALEALAGEQACLNGSEHQIAEVQSLHERMVEMSPTADPVDFFTTDMAFHRAIVLAAGNGPLTETHQHYNTRLWRARFLTSSVMKDRARVLAQHGEVAAALVRRDGPTVSATLRDHLAHGLRNITAIYERGLRVPGQ